jgi:hypothetical protein
MELRSVEAIVEALNQCRARYFIVGGLAVNAHGYVRMTRDVDIVVQLTRDNILSALNALFSIGYRMAIPVTAEEFADPRTRESWRNEKNMLVLKLWSDAHGRTPIDIFVYEPFDFSTEETRKCALQLNDHLTAPVVSLQTLLDMKRDAGRPQDRIDIEELTRIP